MLHICHWPPTCISIFANNKLFCSWFYQKQETNTEISTAMSDPNPPQTSESCKEAVLSKQTSLTIIDNIHLMQSISFALTSKTTDYRFLQHAQHTITLPSKRNSWLILNSCVLLVSYWQWMRSYCTGPDTMPYKLYDPFICVNYFFFYNTLDNQVNQ